MDSQFQEAFRVPVNVPVMELKKKNLYSTNPVAPKTVGQKVSGSLVSIEVTCITSSLCITFTGAIIHSSLLSS